MPTISVIVPVNNRGDLLSATLSSLMNQTFNDWECIIVDDHSTDNSITVAQQYSEQDKRFKVVTLPDPKRYVCAARNYGFYLSNTEYVTFMDAGLLFTNNKLEEQLHIFTDHPALDAVTCRHIFFDTTPENCNPQSKFAPPNIWLDVMWNAEIFGGLWQTSSPLWRTDLLLEIGCWNENIRAWTDPELNLRSLLHRAKFARMEKILVFIKRGAKGSVSSKPPLEKNPLLVEGLLAGWKTLKKAGGVTELRKLILADRFFQLSKSYLDNNRLVLGVVSWMRWTSKIDLNRERITIGFLLLVANKFNKKHILELLYPGFFNYRSLVPPPLPDVTEIPTYLL